VVDEWVTKTRAKGLAIQVSDGDVPLALVGTGAGDRPARTLTFANGSRLVLYMRPAAIDGGKWKWQFALSPQYEPKSRPTEGYQFTIVVDPGRNECRLVSNGRGQYRFQDYTSPQCQAPARDSAFTGAIRAATNEVMAYVIGDNSDL
jgi:hypothetical protein